MSQHAMRVRALHTPSGIPLWHVEDYTVPVVSMEFAFLGGAAQDPAGQSGLANLMASLLDEGTGELDSEAFHEALEERAIELSFDAGRDRVDGSPRMLAEEADAAFRLLGLALQSPRFEASAIERVRGQILSSLKRDESDPQVRARDALYRVGFQGHAYANPVDGVLKDVSGLTRDAILTQYKRLLAQDGLFIVAVGAISEARLIAGVEAAFAPLPAQGMRTLVKKADLTGLGTQTTIDLDIPQSTLYPALPGLERKDPDFMTGYVVNHILGAGVFSSRMWVETREKRGLAYSVWSMLSNKAQASLFLAGTATSNERVSESLHLMQTEIETMAKHGPTAEELEKAKTYLAGSYALRFDSSRKIANELLEIMLDDLGIDYIDRRNQEIMAVTLSDAKRVAQRLFHLAKPLIIAAGRPQRLEQV